MTPVLPCGERERERDMTHLQSPNHTTNTYTIQLFTLRFCTCAKLAHHWLKGNTPKEISPGTMHIYIQEYTC